LVSLHGRGTSHERRGGEGERGGLDSINQRPSKAAATAIATEEITVVVGQRGWAVRVEILTDGLI
jgi:hypothetical protein